MYYLPPVDDGTICRDTEFKFVVIVFDKKQLVAGLISIACMDEAAMKPTYADTAIIPCY